MNHEHQYVFLRSENNYVDTVISGRHVRESYDVFYCTKCLERQHRRSYEMPESRLRQLNTTGQLGY